MSNSSVIFILTLMTSDWRLTLASEADVRLALMAELKASEYRLICNRLISDTARYLPNSRPVSFPCHVLYGTATILNSYN